MQTTRARRKESGETIYECINLLCNKVTHDQSGWESADNSCYSVSTILVLLLFCLLPLFHWQRTAGALLYTCFVVVVVLFCSFLRCFLAVWATSCWHSFRNGFMFRECVFRWRHCGPSSFVGDCVWIATQWALILGWCRKCVFSWSDFVFHLSSAIARGLRYNCFKIGSMFKVHV